MTEFLQFYIFMECTYKEIWIWVVVPRYKKKGNNLGIYWSLYCPVVLSPHAGLLPVQHPAQRVPVCPHMVLEPPGNSVKNQTSSSFFLPASLLIKFKRRKVKTSVQSSVTHSPAGFILNLV